MKPLPPLVFLKKRSKALIHHWWVGGILLLLVFSHWSQAQQCQVIMSQGSLNYGRITQDKTTSSGDLGWRTLPERNVSLTLLCEETTRDRVLKLSGATVSSDPHFAFGDNGRTKIELVNPNSAIELERSDQPLSLVSRPLELLAEDRLHITEIEGKKPLTLQLKVTPRINENAWSVATVSELNTAVKATLE
ncbi:hypothetical protein [Candidatus Regiella endosymbiont of Tuberolachnus salignus]|uniref:hypothetical protein n=1 Tax=Candidatus Regiella endosymbiont of Tuberolachnus salignus TaxID=3077956 RepID=UPI0030CA8ECB